MTISQLKSVVASYFKVEVADLTLNGVDLFLSALNTVRLNAELNYDFEFTRQEVSVVVNGVTGGSLETAVLSGTSTAARVKSVVDVLLANSEGAKYPVEWTSKVESLGRMREDMPFENVRYLNDDESSWGQSGQPRFELANRAIRAYPKRTETTDETVYLEAYVFSPDWTGIAEYAVTYVSGSTTYSEKLVGNYSYFGQINGEDIYASPRVTSGKSRTSFLQYNGGDDVWYLHFGTLNEEELTLYWSKSSEPTEIVGQYISGTNSGEFDVAAVNDTTTDVWLTYGHEFLLWSVIVHLNHKFKEFVYRQEGNLMPPDKLAAVALENFKSWDATYLEQYRRHGR